MTRGRTGTGISSHGILSPLCFGGLKNERYFIKKDLIAYLIHEIERVKKTTPQECELHNYSFVQGHKEGNSRLYMMF